MTASWKMWSLNSVNKLSIWQLICMVIMLSNHSWWFSKQPRDHRTMITLEACRQVSTLTSSSRLALTTVFQLESTSTDAVSCRDAWKKGLNCRNSSSPTTSLLTLVSWLRIHTATTSYRTWLSLKTEIRMSRYLSRLPRISSDSVNLNFRVTSSKNVLTPN